jgi:hypothetical protein
MTAQAHTILRFAFGVTAAFVLSEAMGWYPSFLPPLLAATLLANLPTALPLKAGVALIVVQAVGAYGALALSMFLRDSPFVLFGAIGLIVFLSFATIAKGRGFLPILLVLVCFATIPIVTIASPQQAGALPFAFVRGMIVAVAIIWLSQLLWPKMRPPTQAATTPVFESPVARALAGTAIVLPPMLVYLMFGLTDALPVLITTVLLVLNFDRKRGVIQGLAMMFGVFIGGLIALVGYALLQIAPSLVALALISFIIAMLFARRIERGGAGAAVAVVTLNQALVMFSLSLVPGPSGPGVWASRLIQFAIACAFAIGMMVLLMPRSSAQTR